MPSSLKYFIDKPSFITRVKSNLIDGGIIIILFFTVSYFMDIFSIDSPKIKGIALLLIVLYEPISVTFSGTIGQLIMGSKVVNAKQFKEEESEQSINFFKALLRFLSKIILGFITLLTIYSDFYGQAIHDKIAGTIVIKR